MYRAEDIKLKRIVALKFLPPELSRDEKSKERFIHEAKAASALEHPNICNIHEIDETEDGQLFICMAYYEGEALKDRIARRLKIFDHRVSIIDCAGKFNLKLYIKVLNALHIHYLVIYDEDPIPGEITHGGNKYDEDKYNESKRIFEENENIVAECNKEFGIALMVKGNFENIIGISRSLAEKVGKPYAAIEYYSNDSNKIPAELEELVKAIYNLK